MDCKNIQKNVFSRWLIEIIQFIRFEMHMDRPDKSKNTLYQTKLDLMILHIMIYEWEKL